MAEHLDDTDVISRVLDGNSNAFALLVERHECHVTKIVAAHVPGDQVREIAHEAFIRAYTSLSGYKPLKPFQNWLTTIALRCCHDYWRVQYRRKESLVCDMSEDGQNWLDSVMSVSSTEAFEAMVNQQEARQVLDLILTQLSPMDRMVLTLTYLEEHTVKETAAMLDISVPNVKVRAFRAKRKLKIFLKRHGIQGGLHES
ncbi:RNA polymerase sigma factor [Pseudodesulfovibrio sediminis]|uniref:ECF RNA polymerase sigma-E factor n=1 Tax=Pseudodesulfovibrio sediminis TaxID=2810563 RepID=A0ABM7P3K4_9BACT|nr:RNA polymerase sigma factor [Pseudodesulfovibrio sediminis]BCS88233.1 ECF RNA polymerase sigma-E factor [Pseudodesulfovibrio sediminis]